MTGAQPNPLHTFEADTAADTVRRTEESEQDQQPDFVGDMPDDPDKAVHYRRGRQQEGQQHEGQQHEGQQREGQQ